MEAVACHLIEDWKGVVFVEEGPNGEQLKSEPAYNAENATKLLNMGDLGVSLWSFIRTESEKIQSDANQYRDDVVGKSQPSTPTPTNTRVSRTTKKQREALGVKLPDAPDYSYVANAILCAYNTIARSRRYEQGVPLALDISAINAYVEQYDLPVERYIFNDCIFTLDDMFLDEAHKKSRKNNSH